MNKQEAGEKMKYKILVIEDDRDISNLICMNLEAAGYETKPVYDGNQAVEQIEKGERCCVFGNFRWI